MGCDKVEEGSSMLMAIGMKGLGLIIRDTGMERIIIMNYKLLILGIEQMA